jgi:hypothetical protein
MREPSMLSIAQQQSRYMVNNDNADNKNNHNDDDSDSDDSVYIDFDDEYVWNDFDGDRMVDDDDDDDDDRVDSFVLGEVLDTSSVILEDIHWRVAKLRLEEQNTQRFLKARPRFLPYNECRKWVQALGRFKTEDDWKEWISMGEKRNSYIPVSQLVCCMWLYHGSSYNSHLGPIFMWSKTHPNNKESAR